MTGSRRRRSLGLLTAGLLGAAAVTGCSSEIEGKASAASAESSSGPSSSSAGESTGSLDDVEDLSAGLLPADAFGAGARATPMTAEEFEQQAELGGGLGLGDVTVTPESCAPALGQVQPGLEDMVGLGAQTVMVGSAVIVEILAEGPGFTDGVAQLAATVETCPQATITAPQIGTATVVFTPLDVPELGDGSSALTMTLTLPGPDGQPLTVPLLLAMAADGERLVSLTSTDPTGTSDPAAFVALVQQAFAHQAAELD